MSSLQDIADSLIRIAYTDKQDRYSWIPLLATKLKSVPSSEISNEQRELISEILDSLGEEVFYAQKAEAEAIGEAQKQAKSKKAKATKAVAVQKQLKLSNLNEGDMFRFPLSEEDLEMGVEEVVYTFDAKRGSTYFYKSQFGTFHTLENREVNLVTEPVISQPEVIEVVEPKVVVKETPQVVIKKPEVVVPKPTPKAKPVAKPKPTPKVKPQPAKDLSFLDDIDDAF